MSKSYRSMLIDAKAKQHIRDIDVRKAMKNAQRHGVDPRNSLDAQGTAWQRLFRLGQVK